MEPLEAEVLCSGNPMAGQCFLFRCAVGWVVNVFMFEIASLFPPAWNPSSSREGCLGLPHVYSV